MKTSFRNMLSKSGFTLAILVGWWLLSHYGPWPRHLFPGPEAVAASFVKMLVDGRLAKATLHSLSRMSQGYLISVAIGVPLGIMMAALRVLREAVKPVLMGLQGLPSICWLPLALLWFGLNDAAIVFVVVMGSLLSIAIGAEDAVNRIDPMLLRVSGTLGIRGLRFYGGGLLTAALPRIVTRVKLRWRLFLRGPMGAAVV